MVSEDDRTMGTSCSNVLPGEHPMPREMGSGLVPGATQGHQPAGKQVIQISEENHHGRQDPLTRERILGPTRKEEGGKVSVYRNLICYYEREKAFLVLR